MKVVLFCGGMGMRIREHSGSIPKPLVPIGERPILWHIMKYYAHYGHKDFILCLGWKANAIKEYFHGRNGKARPAANESVKSNGPEQIRYDEEGWNITFVDTGLDACIGQRLKAVQPYLEGEEIFLANYADGLSDLPLPNIIDSFRETNPVGMFVSVPPRYVYFHSVASQRDGTVSSMEPLVETDVWMNGGFFTFSHEIFDYIRDGEDLVDEPFKRLIAARKLRTMKFEGFWASMDTYKEKQLLDDLHAGGSAPWEVWKGDRPAVSYSRRPGTNNLSNGTSRPMAVGRKEP